MTEKIEWYREVLELDPNSRIFFALARLLVKENLADEAIETLYAGLQRHPEYLEARLLLIELLYSAGEKKQCRKQVKKLGDMLAAYAGFWQAWAACLDEENRDPDTVSILHFLAAQFISGPIKLHEVLNRGVQTILAERKAQAESTAETRPEQRKDADSEIDSAALAGAALQPVRLDTLEADSEEKLEPAPAGNTDSGTRAQSRADDAEQMQAEIGISTKDGNGDFAASGSDEGVEGLFTIRTQSMADVLEEQGDLQGALDIYLELAQRPNSREKQKEYAEHIDSLKTRLNMAKPESAQQVQESVTDSRDNSALIHMLGKLAQRLEARARS